MLTGFRTIRKHLARGITAVALLAQQGMATIRAKLTTAEVRAAANDDGVRAAERARQRQRFLRWYALTRAWAANNAGRAFDAPGRDCPGYFWKQDCAGPAWRLYRERP